MATAPRAWLLAGGAASRAHYRSSFSAVAVASWPVAASWRPRVPALTVAGSPLVPAGRRAFSILGPKLPTDGDVDLDSIAYGYIASQALFTALKLEIFDKIAAAGDSGVRVADLGEAIGINGPRLQTLLTSLVAIKCLKVDANGLYRCSVNITRFMVSSSEHYYGDFLKLQMDRPFHHQMGGLAKVMTSGEDPKYSAAKYWPAKNYGSEELAKDFLIKQKLDGANRMLDVAGGFGAFSYTVVGATPGLESTVLEVPAVCRAAEQIREREPAYVRNRVNFIEMDANSVDWPVESASFDVVVMSYVSGSVPEPVIGKLYANAFQALRSGGRLFVHDFIVDDTFAGPALAALWALQHVTVNAEGLCLSPSEIISRMESAGFDQGKSKTLEMIEGMTKLVIGYKS